MSCLSAHAPHELILQLILLLVGVTYIGSATVSMSSVLDRCTCTNSMSSVLDCCTCTPTARPLIMNSHSSYERLHGSLSATCCAPKSLLWAFWRLLQAVFLLLNIRFVCQKDTGTIDIALPQASLLLQLQSLHIVAEIEVSQFCVSTPASIPAPSAATELQQSQSC